MNRGMWRTKEDVLKDLEVASGRRVADVSDSFLVVGEQPPPPRMISDDDVEIELRFGQSAATHRLDQGDQPGPDLNGITKMLRMVQDYEKSSHGEADGQELVTPNKKHIISKLNPNVKEFIPKSAKKESSENVTIRKDNVIQTNDFSTISTIGSNIKKDKSEINDPDVVNSTKTDVDEINREHTKESKKEIAKMLRNKISMKKDTFEHRRQANLAIVHLIKLYAKPEPKSEQSKPLKLLTPQFFQTCKASDFQSNVGDTTNTDNSIKQVVSPLNAHEIKNIGVDLNQSKNLNLNDKDNCDGAVSENDSSNKKANDDFVIVLKENNDSSIIHKDDSDILNEATTLTPEMEDASIADKIPFVVVEKTVDPEIAESVTKVNNWLDNKPYVNDVNDHDEEKPKGPAMYLGPVAYKRKDRVTCKSPSEVAGKKISKSSDNSYKPSSYADELLKKYKEKTKKPTTPTLNIWEKLEQDLKKKDEEIRNRKKQA